VPNVVRRTSASCAPTLPAKDPAGGQDQRYLLLVRSRSECFRKHERPLPRTNSSLCHDRRPSGAASLHGHWMLPSRRASCSSPGERRGQARGRSVSHDVRRVLVIHRVVPARVTTRRWPLPSSFPASGRITCEPAICRRSAFRGTTSSFSRNDNRTGP